MTQEKNVIALTVIHNDRMAQEKNVIALTAEQKWSILAWLTLPANSFFLSPSQPFPLHCGCFWPIFRSALHLKSPSPSTPLTFNQVSNLCLAVSCYHLLRS